MGTEKEASEKMTSPNASEEGSEKGGHFHRRWGHWGCRRDFTTIGDKDKEGIVDTDMDDHNRLMQRKFGGWGKHWKKQVVEMEAEPGWHNDHNVEDFLGHTDSFNNRSSLSSFYQGLLSQRGEVWGAWGGWCIKNQRKLQTNPNPTPEAQVPVENC